MPAPWEKYSTGPWAKYGDEAARQGVVLPQDEPLDTSGAPAHVRLIVGGASDPESRLATLRNFFPDAQPAGEDNFTYTNPETGVRTLYNPKGLDFGDVASVSREAAQGVGATVGGIGGAAVGGPGAAFLSAPLGAAAADEVFNFATRPFGREDLRTPEQHLEESRNVAVFSGAGGAGGSLTGAGVRGGTKMAVRGGAAGRAEAESAIEDLARWGVSPSVAQATQSATLDSVEQLVSRFPGGAGVFRRAVRDTTDKIAETMRRKTDAIVDVSDAAEVGGVIRGGIENYAERFRNASGQLYGQVGKHIPGDTVVPLSNLRTKLAEMGDAVPEIPELNALIAGPGVRKMQSIFGDGGVTELPYQTLARVRSAIGAKLANPSLIDDINRADMKRIYGAITEDMKVAAQGSGPDALRAFNRANAFYRRGIEKIDTMLEPIADKKLQEDVFLALEQSGKRGATRLREVRSALTKDQWEIVAKAAARKLGRATPGQQDAAGDVFSYETFLTNWSKMDGSAKSALFDGVGSLRADLDALARASGRVRESSRAFANPSGTAGAMTGQIMILAGSGGLAFGRPEVMMTVASAALGANRAAHLMTSPRFVRWLAQSTKVEPNKMGAHIGRLSGVAANADPETRQAITDLLGVMGAAADRSTESNQ